MVQEASLSSPASGLAPLTITIVGAYSGASGQVSYTMNFGDGTNVTGTDNNATDSIIQSHSYTVAGSYQVSFICSDKSGLPPAIATLVITLNATSATGNVAFLALPANVGPTSSTTYVSSGFGVSITSKGSGRFLILFNGLAINSVASSATYMSLFRTTGAIPSAGSTTTGTQLTTAPPAEPVASLFALGAIVFMDAGLILGQTYNYYIAWKVASGSSTMYSFNAVADYGTNIYVQEV